MASIPVSGDMKAPDYKSMTAILSEGYDTIPGDFSDEDADRVVLSMAQHVLEEHRDRWEEPEERLVAAMKEDGLAFEEATAQTVAVAAEVAMQADLDESIR